MSLRFVDGHGPVPFDKCQSARSLAHVQCPWAEVRIAQLSVHALIVLESAPV